MPDYEVKLKITTDATGAITGMAGAKGAIKDLESQSASLASQFKANWLAVTAAVTVATLAIKKAFDYMELGARAMQAEEAFRNVTASYKVNADKLIADLKRVTNATIDDSDLMQQAMRGLIAGFSGNEVTKIFEIARLGARNAGRDIKEAAEDIAVALETNMPRGLKYYLLITKEQQNLIEGCQKLGIEVGLLDFMVANYNVQLAAQGKLVTNASEVLQQQKKTIAELGEEIGKFLIGVAARYIDFWKNVIEQTSYFIKIIDILSQKMQEFIPLKPTIAGQKAQKELADTAKKTTEEIVKGTNEQSEATKHAQDTLAVLTKYYEDLMKAAKKRNEDAKQYAKEEKQRLEELKRLDDEALAAAMANIKAVVDAREEAAELKLKTEIELQDAIAEIGLEGYDLEIYRLKKSVEEYEKTGADKELIAEYYNRSIAEIEQKRIEDIAKAEMEARDKMANSIESFVNTIMGQGKDLEDWLKNSWERLKGWFAGMVIKMVAQWIAGMAIMSSVGPTMNVAGVAGATTGGGGWLSSLFGGGGTGGGWSGQGLSLGGSLLNIGAGIGGSFGALGSLFGISTAAGAQLGVAGVGLLGTIGAALPAIGIIAGGIMLLTKLFGGQDPEEYRAPRRAGYWTGEFGGILQAPDWEGMLSQMSTYPTYFPLRGPADQYTATGNWPEYRESLAPFDVNQPKMNIAGWDFTGLKEAGVTLEQYNETFGQWDNMIVAVTKTLDDNKTATVASASALADYGDMIDKVKELMPSWGEKAQEAGQALIDLYEKLKLFITTDIWQKFIDGTGEWGDVLQALVDLGLTPLEQQTFIVSQSLKSLLEEVEIGSETFNHLWDILSQGVISLADLNRAQTDMATIQSLLVSGIDFTQEEVAILVTYYRLLQDVLEGNTVDMEAYTAAQKEATDVVNEHTAAVQGLLDTIISTKAILGGATSEEAYAAVIGARYDTNLNPVDIRATIDWYLKATPEEIEAFCTKIGISSDQLSTDLLWAAEKVDYFGTTAAAAAVALATTILSLEEMLQRLGGATEDQIQFWAFKQRYGVDVSGMTSEEWEAYKKTLLALSPEEIATWLGIKDFDPTQFISDIMWMDEHFNTTTEDLAALNDQISALEQSLSSWQSLVDSINNQLLGYQFGTANPQTAIERLGLVKAQIGSIMGGMSLDQLMAGLTEEERISTIQNLADLWDQYLSIAQEAFQRPSIEYQAIFDEVTGALGELLNYSKYQVSEYEIQLEQLNYLKIIAENTALIAGVGIELPGGGYPNPLGTSGMTGWTYDGLDMVHYINGVEIERLHPGDQWYTPPMYQSGIDYVPKTGLAYLHQGEKVIPANENEYGQISVVINVNESKTPRATGIAVRDEFDRYIRSGPGRKSVQNAARGH